jgi:hypothetical protein
VLESVLTDSVHLRPRGQILLVISLALSFCLKVSINLVGIDALVIPSSSLVVFDLDVAPRSCFEYSEDSDSRIKSYVLSKDSESVKDPELCSLIFGSRFHNFPSRLSLILHMDADNSIQISQSIFFILSS